MAGFLKILLRNVLEGPSTDPFPLGETFTPKRFRGKVLLDPDLCMGCGICRHTCAAGAINIHVRPDQSGYDFTVWHNSCCLCASCRHYCPTGAITLTTDWHNAHTQEEKFTWLEQKFVPYIPCEVCGTPMRPTPLSIAKKIYVNNSDVDLEHIIKLCPKCRQMEDARRHAEVPMQPEGAPDALEGAVAEKTESAPAEAPAAPAPAVEATAPEKQPQPTAVAPKAPAETAAPKAPAEATPAPKAESAPAPVEQAPAQAAPPVKAAPKAEEKPQSAPQPAAVAPKAPAEAVAPKAETATPQPAPVSARPAPAGGKPAFGKGKPASGKGKPAPGKGKKTK